MAQKNRVQDGTVVFSTNDPATYDLGFNVQGNVNVTKALVVAQSNLSDAVISSSTGTDLQLTVSPGAAANIRIYPPVDGGNVIINNVVWINNTPNLGGFVGASSTNTLRYYPFVAGNEISDTLTISYLNTNYPNITPGQMVVGSTVVYLNVGLGTWRILSNQAATELYSAITASDINLSLGTVFSKTITSATTLTVSNVASTGKVSSFTLELTNGGAFSLTWFSNVRWASGTPPTLTVSGTDILSFYTRDAGANWRGTVLAKDSK